MGFLTVDLAIKTAVIAGAAFVLWRVLQPRCDVRIVLTPEAVQRLEGVAKRAQREVVKSEAKGDSSKAVKLVLKSDAEPVSAPFQIVGSSKEPAELSHHATFSLGGTTTQCKLPWLTVIKAK